MRRDAFRFSCRRRIVRLHDKNAVRHRETTYKSSYPGRKKAMSVLPRYIQKWIQERKIIKFHFPWITCMKRMKKKKKKGTNETINLWPALLDRNKWPIVILGVRSLNFRIPRCNLYFIFHAIHPTLIQNTNRQELLVFIINRYAVTLAAAIRQVLNKSRDFVLFHFDNR